MKALVLIMGLFVFGHSEIKNDLSRQNLKGKVRTVIHCQFPVFYGQIDTDWSTIYVFKYDERGNQVEDADYTGGSFITGFGKLNHKRIYKYDDNGNQTEVYEYNPDGTVSQKVVYEYDNNGNRIGRKNYTPDGKLWRRSVFKYNDRGQQVTCDKYSADSVLLEQLTYKYDEKGNMAAELLYVYRLNDTSDKRKIYDPSDPNKVVRLDYVKTFSYDDSGKKIGEVNNIYGTSFPFTTAFKYAQYDTAGNWGREEFIENGKPTNIIERVIEYY